MAAPNELNGGRFDWQGGSCRALVEDVASDSAFLYSWIPSVSEPSHLLGVCHAHPARVNVSPPIQPHYSRMDQHLKFLAKPKTVSVSSHIPLSDPGPLLLDRDTCKDCRLSIQVGISSLGAPVTKFWRYSGGQVGPRFCEYACSIQSFL